MSYIITNANPFVSIKLTEKGREKLSMGQLTFSSWAIGDSEINYDREGLIDSNPSYSATTKIMRPFDKQPNIKSFITNSNAASPYQLLDNSNLNVIKAIVNNEANDRGFFTELSGSFTTITSSDISPYNQLLPNSNLNGTTNIAGVSTSAITVGDFILLKLRNDDSVSIPDNSNDKPIPHLWFKVKSFTGTTVTVDRKTPNMASDSASSQLIIYKNGEVYDTIATGNTTAYWDSGTLEFDSGNNITCNDVPVWNMNNVWSENIAGITGLTTTNLYEDYTKFGSYEYIGSKFPYFEYPTTTDINSEPTSPCSDTLGVSYDDNIKKSISIIHFTNNSISNLYGEFLYVDATVNKIVKVITPDLMYHRRNFATGSGTTMGMTFISSGLTKYIGTSDIEYIDLVEDPTLVSGTPLVVGKVFPQLKTIVIDDDEIVAAISYKSNRNWTLPKLAANLITATGSTGVLGVDETIYLTYSLQNTLTGLMTSLPNQKYVKLTNGSSSSKDVSFRISDVDLLPYMRKIESAYDGLGFYADKFKLMYQIVSNANDRPEAGSWKEVDFTSTAINGGSGTINPKLLEAQNGSNGFLLTPINAASATTFSLIDILNMAPNVSPNDLQFGDERFFYGNFKSFIGASIYKTIFDIRINSGIFNSTSNSTRSNDASTNPPNIRISEVGIYDDTATLVCIGKLNKPISIISGNSIMLELSMDF